MSGARSAWLAVCAQHIPIWEYAWRPAYLILTGGTLIGLRKVEGDREGNTSRGRNRMDLKLKGRRALVTGSSSGIGEGIARMLAQEGCAVVVHGRNRERAEKVAADIKAAGVAIGDLSTDEGAAAVHAEARTALGGNIEILINNAGGSSTGNTTKAPIEISPADWVSNYHANALPSVRLCRLAVPDMVAAKFGRVINVSSAVAVQPNNLGADYSGAKAALNNFTVSLAGSLKGVGVTVNTVSPGIIMVDGLIRLGRKKYGDANHDDRGNHAAIGRRQGF